jgi:HD-GYP domain-containing protein (c-di-GMP phosphodiesterase class II)
VVWLSVAVAEAIGVDDQARRQCEFGALLHDVGKLRVPKAIINKPGPLDADEWSVMRMHTIEGQAMLERVGGVLGTVGEVVRASHERWDGTGYPDGLAGEAIPLAARIVAACDAYNAMTTDRPYRRALPADVAREELRDGAGSQFDPLVVAALLRVLGVRPDPSAAGVRIDVEVVDPEGGGSLGGEAEGHRGAVGGQQGE